MNATVNTCTLCSGSVTTYASPNFGRYSALDCTKCGQFVVSQAADARIRGLQTEFKDKCRSIIASATKDSEILLMSIEPVGAGGNLKVELVPRTSLQL